MKWYFWVLIIVVVLVIIYFVWKKNHPSKKIIIKSLNGQFGDLLNDSLESDPRKIVQDLIDLSVKIENEKGIGTFGFIKVKELAKNSGVLVLDSNETHTLKYNPKRVIVKQTYSQCIKAPCPVFLSIESVG